EAFRNDEFNAQNAPFLWQLAQENIWFRNYRVVASATRPSVTSFFTSLYPAQHGCYNLALGQTGQSDASGHASVKVADTIEAFPRLLQDIGYRTLMVTSNGLTADPVFGFEDVFRRFDATEPYRFRIPSFNGFVGFDFLNWKLRLTRIFKIIFFNPEHSTTYFEAPRVNKTVQREMERHDYRPLLLYAHYMEPHSPYYHHPHQATQINFYAPSQRGKLLSAYRSEIRAADQAIAELFAYWELNGMLENTYVFITADHGEEFYDHRNWGHGKSLYPEAISVPAILLLPPDQRRALQIDTAVENIDVSATILDLAGLTVPEIYEGRSLVPLFSDQGAVADFPLDQRATFSQFDDGKVFWASMVTNDGWQVIFKGRDENRQTMLFDLKTDPLAKQNLFGQGIATQDSLVNQLTSNLARLEASAPLFQGELEAIDPEQLEQLRALGYVD
ncbi:MAG: sulfatase, partial [bacterium]